MQFRARDGSRHPSQLKAFQASQAMRLPALSAAGRIAPEGAGEDAGVDDGEGQDIQSDPQAMRLVDQLKELGYSGDEVAQAMDAADSADAGGGVRSSQSPRASQDRDASGQAAAQAAPLQIPGI